VPTLIIVGELELTDYRDVAGVLAARVPGARTRTLPGVGHLTNMQAPEAFNQAVLDFLADLSGSQPTDAAGAGVSR
jgi:pimeloyl-ACP methyl ester carboxylesterase